MKKYVWLIPLLLLFLFSGQWLGAQELLQTHEIQFSRKGNAKFVYPVVDESNLESYLLLHDPNFLKIYHYSLGFLLKDTLTLANSQLRLNNGILGARIQNPGQVRYFWTDEEISKIYSATIDVSHAKVFSFEPTDIQAHEWVIQAFSHQNTFYVLTSGKKERWLRLYAFDQNEKPVITTIPMSDFELLNSENQKLNLQEVLRRETTLEFPYAIERIDANMPTQLMQSAKKRKMYVEKNRLLISFDFNSKYTEWLLLDLKEKSVTRHRTDYETIVTDEPDMRLQNSFYHQGKVYQIQRIPEGGLLRVVDFEKNNVLAHFPLGLEKIEYRNSALFFQPTERKPIREFKKEKFFYRKAKNSHWGVTVYPSQDHLWLTVGAVKENLYTSYLIGEFFLNAVVMASGGGYAPFILGLSPEMYQSVFFDVKLDVSNRHRAGQVGPTAHTKIGIFLNDFPDAQQITVFKRGSYYVLGYYIPTDKKYYLRAFD